MRNGPAWEMTLKMVSSMNAAAFRHGVTIQNRICSSAVAWCLHQSIRHALANVSSSRAGKLISSENQIGLQHLRRLEILPTRLDGDDAVTQVAKIADDVLDQRLAFVTFGKCRFHL